MFIDNEEDTIICGDFNFDYWKSEKNMIRVMLESKGFTQVVKEATTIHGNCIDHLYVRISNLNCRYHLYYPYYTDHEAICFMLKKNLLCKPNDWMPIKCYYPWDMNRNLGWLFTLIQIKKSSLQSRDVALATFVKFYLYLWVLWPTYQFVS